jgi:hypothetical protein
MARVLHGLLTSVAFIGNLLFAAIAGVFLAALVSFLLYRLLPFRLVMYAEDFTTLLPAFGLGYLMFRSFHQRLAKWIWVPAVALWLLMVLPDVANFTGQNCTLSKSEYFLREYLLNSGKVCGDGLGWPLYTLPTLCCIGYSLGAKFAARGEEPRVIGGSFSAG